VLAFTADYVRTGIQHRRSRLETPRCNLGMVDGHHLLDILPQALRSVVRQAGLAAHRI
jgi:hypothetical protein